MEENKHLDIIKPGLSPAKPTSRQAFIDNDQLKHDPMMRTKSGAASNETTQDNNKPDDEKSINDNKNGYKDSAYSEDLDSNLVNDPSREHKKSSISPLTSEPISQDEKPGDNDEVDDARNNHASQDIDSSDNDTQLEEPSNQAPNKIEEENLDLHKIPTSSDTPPTRLASFSAVNDATASLPPDKTTITSSLASSEEGEVLRKSSKDSTASKAFTETNSFTDTEEHEVLRKSSTDKEVNKGSDELPGGVIETKNNVEDQRADLVKSLVEEKTYKLPIRTMSSKNIVRVAVVLVILAVGILIAVGFLLTKNS